MLNINPQYLVNHKGEKTAAVLSMQEYRLLMQHLEDLEDILDMDTAAKGETHFRDYREIQAELTGQTGTKWRIRVGMDRILYEINDRQALVNVYRIKHRRHAYDR